MRDLLENSVIEKEDFNAVKIVKYHLFYNFRKFEICVNQKFKQPTNNRDFIEEDIEFIKKAHIHVKQLVKG